MHVSLIALHLMLKILWVHSDLQACDVSFHFHFYGSFLLSKFLLIAILAPDPDLTLSLGKMQTPEEGTEEWKLLDACKNPKDWAA